MWAVDQTGITNGLAMLLLVIIGAVALVALLWAWHTDQAAHEDREAEARFRDAVRRYNHPSYEARWDDDE